jgi:DNA invertase Pin-like site-specific DNA recombinase
MTLTVGYARISSTKQDLETQRKMLKSAGCTDVRSETGSGAKSDRPIMQALITEAISRAAAGEDVEVVVVRLDRWGRSLPDLIASLERFSAAGVRFRSLSDAGIRLDGSPSAMLTITVLAAAAAYERALILQRTMEKKRATGRWGGRPRSLTETQTRRAWNRIEEGESTSGVARDIGISRRTLYRAFERAGLTGGAE